MAEVGLLFIVPRPASFVHASFCRMPFSIESWIFEFFGYSGSLHIQVGLSCLYSSQYWYDKPDKTDWRFIPASRIYLPENRYTFYFHPCLRCCLIQYNLKLTLIREICGHITHEHMLGCHTDLPARHVEMSWALASLTMYEFFDISFWCYYTSLPSSSPRIWFSVKLSNFDQMVGASIVNILLIMIHQICIAWNMLVLLQWPCICTSNVHIFNTCPGAGNKAHELASVDLWQQRSNNYVTSKGGWSV